MCEERASWASVLFLAGYEKCLVLWALLPPEELDGINPRNHVLALEILHREQGGGRIEL